MNIEETMSFINSFSKSGKPITDLSRAEELMRLIGEPEKKLKFVHVAGTNGKGSTVEYISNALIYSGYKTGQFTSPFVLRYTDRIRINGEEIDEASLCALAEFIKSRITGTDYSQFEITMAIAFLWFVKENCDIVVLETGIGGLLDSTNVIPPPLLSVITSISLDHTDILGDTVEKIAVQKAGIIKENSAVVLSADNDRNRKVIKIIKEAAKNNNAEFIMPKWMNINFGHEADGNDFIYKNVKYKPAMLGVCQPYNAITAIEACRYLRQKGFDISNENIKKAIETSQIKARMQYIKGNPPVIVDGGHNPDGIHNLASTVENMPFDSICAVMGMVDSKDYKDGVHILGRVVDKIFTVDDFAPNAVKSEKLAEIVEEYTNAEACSSLDEAVEKAKAFALEYNGMVVICGSLYLASEYLNYYDKLI